MGVQLAIIPQQQPNDVVEDQQPNDHQNPTLHDHHNDHQKPTDHQFFHDQKG